MVTIRYYFEVLVNDHVIHIFVTVVYLYDEQTFVFINILL